MKGFHSLRHAIAILAISIMIHLGAAGTLWAAPVGFASREIAFPEGFRGAAALSFAPDGTLYVAEAVSFFEPQPTTTIHVVLPDGSLGTPIPLVGDSPSVISIGDMVVDPASGDLIISDNAPGAETLYSVHPTTGVKTSHASFVSLTSIDKLAARPSGEILVGNAEFSPDGAIWEVDLGASSIRSVVMGLDLPGGLGFDSAGDLVIQQATSNFIAEVFHIPVDDSGSSLMYGVRQLLADGLSAGFDLVVDSEDDVFISGLGGLFELDRNSLGEFTGTATSFDAIVGEFGTPFATGVSFLPGADPFEPFAGTNGGVLAYIPDFSHPTVTLITPVPEPSTLMLLAWAMVLFAWRRQKRR